jgi:hypothetical protein
MFGKKPGLSEMLAEATTANRTDVIAALQRASVATGSDFHYLLNTAMRESSLKPQAQSSTSSASGLFQFVEQTWLGMVKEHGAQYGLGQYANAISKGSDGRYHTANNADRQAILALRNDPQTAAYMEGEYAQASRAQLKSGLGRDVCGGELYAAHFLGNDAACKLIQLSQNNPTASAAKAFPAAAGANRSVFFNTDGTSKTVRDVYNWALSKHGDAPVSFKQPANDAGNDAVAPGKVYLGGNADTDARLASMEFNMLAPSWMSSMGSNSSDDDAQPAGGSVPHTPFMMTPGVIDLLSSMSPANTGKVADRRAAS